MSSVARRPFTHQGSADPSSTSSSRSKLPAMTEAMPFVSSKPIGPAVPLQCSAARAGQHPADALFARRGPARRPRQSRTAGRLPPRGAGCGRASRPGPGASDGRSVANFSDSGFESVTRSSSPRECGRPAVFDERERDRLLQARAAEQPAQQAGACDSRKRRPRGGPKRRERRGNPVESPVPSDFLDEVRLARHVHAVRRDRGRPAGRRWREGEPEPREDALDVLVGDRVTRAAGQGACDPG